MHGKIILFDSPLLLQKPTIQAGYAEQSIKQLWPILQLEGKRVLVNELKM